MLGGLARRLRPAVRPPHPRAKCLAAAITAGSRRQIFNHQTDQAAAELDLGAAGRSADTLAGPAAHAAEATRPPNTTVFSLRCSDLRPHNDGVSRVALGAALAFSLFVFFFASFLQAT